MAPPKRIGKYDVLEVIGRGGMGVVYKATDPMLGRLVAIKVMTGGFADDPDLLKRFYREAQSTASLTHPNIVTVYDMGDQDGMPYLVMQFLDGESLHTIIKSRRELSLLTKTNYLLQVCLGLQYAHERQITHRDIKPANIMVLPDGNVKIVDFGIARIGDDHLTRPGQVIGSIHYMSPEQINEREVDRRSDIFALGTVSYELLAYALPFEGQDVSSTLLKILRDPPPPLSTYLRDYPAEFDAILGRALEKSKEDRYQSADEFAFDLAQIQVQLRKEMIAELLDQAEKLISTGNLAHAREHLQHVIKFDPQNAKANDRMRQVQQEIQQQRRREQAHQLLVQAQALIAERNLDPALHLLDQAIGIDTENFDIKALRDRVAEDAIRDRVKGEKAEVTAKASDAAHERLSSGTRLSPAALRAKQLRDKSILEATPPEGIVLSGPLQSELPTISLTQNAKPSSAIPLEPSPHITEKDVKEVSPTTGYNSVASEWQADVLRAVEKQLAIFLGPLARILVKKAASSTADLDELYTLLAANLERLNDRQTFLARKVEISRNLTKRLSTQESLPIDSTTTNANDASSAELTPEAVERAAHLLARYIGPIASVLVKRAARRADSQHSLYQLLAEHVEIKAERDRFLRDAGFAN